MSGEMELEPVPQGLGVTDKTLFGSEGREKVIVVILPDEPVEPVADNITLDGDPADGGKGLPGPQPQDETDLPGDPYDVGKGLG